MKRNILTENEINEICIRLGKEINDKFKDDVVPPVLIIILKGAANFGMDLIKHIDCLIEIDFAQYSSYLGMSSTGNIVVKKEIEANIKDRNVIIVEDIVDSGLTLSNYINTLKSLNPKHIYTCVLLDKPSGRKVDLKIDYVGKVIGDGFVVGYGLDYKQYIRNTKDIYVIDGNEDFIKEIDKIDEIVNKED